MFAYPSAKFEAIGNPYINEKDLSNIVESKNLNEFKETLNSSKDYNVVGDDTYSVQKSLDDNFLLTIDMMKKDSSKKMNDFYNTYLEKIDIYLIKNELKKLILAKTEEVDIDSAILPSTKEFLTKLKESGKENLPELLKSYGFEKELIEVILKENPDLMKIDVIIDRHIINKLEQVGVPHKCEGAKQSYIRRALDIFNIKNILRAKQLGYDANTCKMLFLGEGREIAPWKFNEIAELEKPPQVISALEGTSYFDVLKDSIELYNKEGSVQVLETVLDGLYIKLIKDISINNYLNLGPTLRFLVSKEFEIKNLKMIAKGIGENLSKEFIKGSLIMEVT
jgi:V/A-type H+-transporting ATPase subunit C